MVRSKSLVSLIATVAGLVDRADARLQDGDPIPGQFIVEYVQSSGSGLLGTLLDPVQSLLNLGIGINIDLQYEYDIFHGALISLDEVEDPQALMAQLLGLDTIQSVWQNRLLKAERPVGALPLGSGLGSNPLGSSPLGSANPLGAASNPLGSSGLGSALGSNPLGSLLGSSPVGRRDDSGSSQFDPAGTFASHISTQVDLLHQKGIFGNGTKIAVIDSGVDYTLEALGGGFGQGFLISFGKDYIGDDFTDDNPVLKPDPDPLDQCGDTHGTHVCGIIAAQPGNKYGIVGAAPGAELGMYRIMSCSGYGPTSVIFQAFLDAMQDGANIITMSASIPSGWKDDALSVIASRVAGAGVIVTTSAGNTGNLGLFAAKSPQQGTHVSAISSFTSSMDPLYGIFTTYTVDGGDPVDFYWYPGSPDKWQAESLPLWTPGYNDTDPTFGCEFPKDTPDLSKYIVLTTYNGCPVDQVAQNAAAKGAKYLIVDWLAYLVPGNVSLDASDGILATAGVDSLQMQAWFDALAANKSVVVTMADPNVVGLTVKYRPSPLAGHPDFFSTFGPTFEMDIKPQFGAPGSNILSTVSKAVGPEGFAVMTGTSMSTPLVAGICALVAQVQGTYDPATIQHLLSATAKPAVHTNSTRYVAEDLQGGVYSFPAPVGHQGAGMVQAYDAAYATILLSRTNIAFNDTANLVSDANFTITNRGDSDVTFTLGHVGAGTAYTFSGQDVKPAPFVYPAVMQVTAEYATIAFGEDQVTVPAGGEVTVTLTVTPPDLNAHLLPIYSGYITGNGTNGENFILPYQGAVGSLNQVQIMADAYLSNSSDTSNAPIKNGTVEFVLPKEGCVDCSNFTVPVASIDLAFGTRILDVKLVDWETGNKLGSIMTSDNYPQTLVSRYSGFNSVFNGTLHDNSTAPAGTYIFEFSALKIYGDASQDTSFEFRRSTPFSISYN